MEIRAANRDDSSAILALIQAKAEFDGCLATLQANEKTIKQAFFSAAPKAKALVAVIDEKAISNLAESKVTSA